MARKRVLEIYRAHGNKIPSIAIFVPSESEVNETAEIINDFQELVELDIKCVPCNQGQALGDSNSLRVFSIDYIKGLEFEAVFFLNIDKVLETRGQNRTSVDLCRFESCCVLFRHYQFSATRIAEVVEGFKEVSNW